MYGFVTGMAAGKLYYPLAEGHFPHVDLLDVARVLAAILADPAPHAERVYSCLAEYQGGNQLASAIGLRVRAVAFFSLSLARVVAHWRGAGSPLADGRTQANRGCTYESVSDATAVAAFEMLGLSRANAVNHVGTLRFFRTGGFGPAGFCILSCCFITPRSPASLHCPQGPGSGQR